MNLVLLKVAERIRRQVLQIPQTDTVKACTLRCQPFPVSHDLFLQYNHR